MTPIEATTRRRETAADAPAGDARAARAAGLDRFAGAAFPVLLAALLVVAYRPTLGRGFTSEDFLLVRRLLERPPWTEPWAGAAGPWLGIEAVRFWRPLATLFFAAEVQLLGAAARGFMVLHLLLHATTATVACVWVRRLLRGPGAAPLAAAVALGWALHPLHPNAVSFPASFATLWGWLFGFAALAAWERARAGSRGALAVGLASLAAGLACYEAVAVVPLVLVAREALWPVDGEPRRWRRLLPFVAVLAAYLAVRGALVGSPLGGYPETAARLLALGTSAARDLLTTLVLLVRPEYAVAVSPRAVLAAAGLCGGVIVASVVPVFARRARPLLFALLVAAAGIAPLAFATPVPATGRYAYLSTLGVALLPAAWAARGSRRVRAVASVATLLLGFLWLARLPAAVAAQLEAGRTASAVRAAIDARQRGPGATEPVFVAGAPLHLENAAGVPLAAVFRYGLRDALAPPFHRPAIAVRPLTLLADRELAPLVLAQPGAVVRWSAGTLRPVAAASAPAALAVGGPADGAAVPLAELADPRLRARPGDESYRLVLVGAINATTVDAAAAPDAALVIPWPREFLQTDARLYGADVYWWVLAARPGDPAAAASPVRRLRVLLDRR